MNNNFSLKKKKKFIFEDFIKRVVSVVIEKHRVGELKNTDNRSVVDYLQINRNPAESTHEKTRHTLYGR